jgi:hypothetical protein
MLKLNKKQIIIKNFIAINVSFLLIFAAVNSTASIQPVLNQDGNLGTTSQMIIFCVQMLTSLVFPQLIIETLGFKIGLVLSEFLQLTYIAVQIYPKSFTLIPSSFHNILIILS